MFIQLRGQANRSFLQRQDVLVYCFIGVLCRIGSTSAIELREEASDWSLFGLKITSQAICT